MCVEHELKAQHLGKDRRVAGPETQTPTPEWERNRETLDQRDVKAKDLRDLHATLYEVLQAS